MVQRAEIPNNSSSIAQSCYERALVMLKDGEVPQAVKQLEMSLEHEPQHQKALATLACYFLNAKDVDRGEPLVARLQARSISRTLRLNLEGEVHLQRNRFDQANQAYQESFSIEQGSTAAVGIARVMNGLNQGKEAEALLRQIISVTSNETPAYDALSDCLMPGDDYQALLGALHDARNPRTYLEIGVATGNSICLAGPATRTIGVDPSPKIQNALSASTQIFEMTSDSFFDQENVAELLGNQPLDLCFIDGLHTFDQALRDFINAEKYAGPDSVFLFHDCFAFEEKMASRKRITTFWAGDVWKVIPILERYRPDLSLQTIRTSPTGLGLVTGMDPTSRVLEDSFDAIVEEYMELSFSYLGSDPASKLRVIDNRWETIASLLP